MPEKSFEDFTPYDMIRIYCRCETFSHSAKFVGVSRSSWIKKWYNSGLPSPKTVKSKTHENDDLDRYEIAIVSDLHWGNIHQQKTIFDEFINECRDRNITFMIGLGDFIEGILARPRHEETRFLHTTSDFEQYFQDNYPTNFLTNIILNGNHEKSLTKSEWRYNFCKEMAIKRHDLTYVESGSIIRGPGGARLCLHHGGGSCAAPGQSRNKRLKTRVLQLMSEEKCAEIFIMGHCHRVNVIPSFMNTFIVGTGCFVAPDDTLLRVFGGVDLCGLILSYSVLDGKPVNIKTDFRFAETYGGTVEHDY